MAVGRVLMRTLRRVLRKDVPRIPMKTHSAFEVVLYRLMFDFNVRSISLAFDGFLGMGNQAEERTTEFYRLFDCR